MQNCPRCNKKISKKYHFEYNRKNGFTPEICKTCQKVVDISQGKKIERPCDPDKMRYFETRGISRTVQMGILEKVKVNP